MHKQVRVLSLLLVAAAGAAFGDDPPKPKEEKAPPAARPAATGKSQPAAEPAKDGAGAKDGAASAAARAAVASPRTLEQALRILQRRRVDVEFKETPLDEVVEFVAKVGRVNAVVSPEYRASAAGALPAVTLKLRDVSLRQLAEIVAKQAGARMVLRDGLLQFTTPADARGTPVLRVFSIAELTFRIRNFPGPDIQLHTGDVRYVQEEEKDEPQPFDDPQTVVDMLKKFTGEGTWDDDAVSISADGTKLVVKQYPEVLKEIAAFLAVLRAAK